MDLKTVQDWILERQMKQIPGVIDVVSFGGQTKEFHIDLDPTKLIAFNVSVSQVMNAIAGSNANVGANYLEFGQESYNVRGIGLFKDIEDIAGVAVTARNGTPVYLKQLGEVKIGEKVPVGRVGKDETADIVQGVILMRRGEKSLPTLDRVRKKVDDLNHGILPKGMRIVPYYDRTNLINVTTHTVTHTLIEGMVLVSLILLAFLGDLRASLVVALTIPLSLLFTFIVMVLRGDSANLISMGAIDFGIIVDASVVMVENIYRHCSQSGFHRHNMRRTTVLAAEEVSSPIFFSSAIIVAAFIPLFTMTGVPGKIFAPMSITYGFALLGALLMAFTLAPVLCSFLLTGPLKEEDTKFVRVIRGLYRHTLEWALRNKTIVIGASVAAMLLTVMALQFIGGEFMPALEEGNLWVRATMPVDISFDQAARLSGEIRGMFRQSPEISTIVSQLGRPDDGTDPTSFFNAEFLANLKPASEWRPGLTKDRLIEEIERRLKSVPGVIFNFSQVIQDNVEEAMSGVKGENSIKLFGNDLKMMEAKAVEIEKVMKGISGVKDLGILRLMGQPNLLIEVNREASARYGLQVSDVNAVVQAAIGGQAVTQVYEGERLFDLVVRFLPEYRQDPEAIGNILVNTPNGARIPLKQLATITTQTGAFIIYRENNERYIPIKFSVRDRDLESTVTEAQAKLTQDVKLPERYRMEWAGQYDQLKDEQARLVKIVPISLILIFVLLYTTFNSLKNALLVLAAVPFALVGGVLSLVATHTHFSISAAVGMISTLGVAILGGVLLVSRIEEFRRAGLNAREAVLRGADVQMRPILMATLAAAIGLLPASVATGIGAQAQQPLARVVVGGMLTAAFLILVVLPVMYQIVHDRDSVDDEE